MAYLTNNEQVSKVTAFSYYQSYNNPITMIPFKDIPFVPSSWDRLEAMVKMSKVKRGQKTVDLGSGDGRMVIAMAKMGAEAHGFEIDPELVEKATQKIKEANLDGKATIHHTNFWMETLDSFDIVTLYGITDIMNRLEKKLRTELKPGAKVISNFFTFPNWEPTAKDGDVYLYIQAPQT